MKVEDIIKTETGMRMYKAVTPGIYNQDPLQLSIFNANGIIMDEVLQRALKMHFDLMIQNATWSLPYWEQLFRITPQDNQTIEQRRRAVILKMNEYSPVTRKRMEAIVDAFTQNGGTEIDDKQGDYIFKIIFRDPGEIKTAEMISAIEEAKPAHLDYLFELLVDKEFIQIVAGTYSWNLNYKRTGNFKTASKHGVIGKEIISITENIYDFPIQSRICGRFRAGGANN